MPAKKKSRSKAVKKSKKKSVAKRSLGLQFVGESAHDPKTCVICSVWDQVSAGWAKDLDAKLTADANQSDVDTAAAIHAKKLQWDPSLKDCGQQNCPVCHDEQPVGANALAKLMKSGSDIWKVGLDKADGDPNQKGEPSVPAPPPCTEDVLAKQTEPMGTCDWSSEDHFERPTCQNFRTLQTTGLVDQAPATQEQANAAANQAYDDYLAAVQGSGHVMTAARIADYDPRPEPGDIVDLPEQPSSFWYGFLCGALAGAAASAIAIFLYFLAQ